MIQVVGYLAALATFVVADMVWLGLMTPRFYRPTLGDILITGVNLPPALVFYLVYPVGLVIFVGQPCAQERLDRARAALWGAVRVFHLCDLRPVELRDVAQLVAAAHRRGHRMG